MEEKTQNAPKKMYICDPSANISCGRQGCVLMGGTCFTTSNQEFAASGPNGLPEEATTRKVLEMKALIKSANNEPENKQEPVRKFGVTSTFFDGRPVSITIIDSETTKIRKHTHDTLWAVMLGFGACAGLVVVIGMIIIGVLSYARG